MNDVVIILFICSLDDNETIECVILLHFVFSSDENMRYSKSRWNSCRQFWRDFRLIFTLIMRNLLKMETGIFIHFAQFRNSCKGRPDSIQLNCQCQNGSLIFYDEYLNLDVQIRNMKNQLFWKICTLIKLNRNKS